MALSRVPGDHCTPNAPQVSSRQRHVLLLTEAAQPAVVTPTPECEAMRIPVIHLCLQFTYYWTIMKANSQRLVSAAKGRKHHHLRKAGRGQTARFCQAVPRGDIRLGCVSARCGCCKWRFSMRTEDDPA